MAATAERFRTFGLCYPSGTFNAIHTCNSVFLTCSGPPLFLTFHSCFYLFWRLLMLVSSEFPRKGILGTFNRPHKLKGPAQSARISTLWRQWRHYSHPQRLVGHEVFLPSQVLVSRWNASNTSYQLPLGTASSRSYPESYRCSHLSIPPVLGVHMECCNIP